MVIKPANYGQVTIKDYKKSDIAGGEGVIVKLANGDPIYLKDKISHRLYAQLGACSVLCSACSSRCLLSQSEAPGPERQQSRGTRGPLSVCTQPWAQQALGALRLA